MRIALVILFSMFFSKVLFAQQVEGFVIDIDTKQRLARVLIYNVHTQTGVYNNQKGEFNIKASPGDQIIASSLGYHSDTLNYKGGGTIYFQLKLAGIRLKEVTINKSKLSPEEKREEALKEFNTTLKQGQTKETFTLGPSGAGLSIDALFSLFSRQGRNARHLRDIIERDYREEYIDYRFSPTLVQSTIAIEGEELKDFMKQFRPSYRFTMDASDYAFQQFIRNAYKSYLIDPAAYRDVKLPEIKGNH